MGSRERAVEVLQFALCGVEVSGLDPYENLASANELVAALESAGLEIVPANLLDAVIAAVQSGISKAEPRWHNRSFCADVGFTMDANEYNRILVTLTNCIDAAIRAAWEGATDEH